jgi:CheY-like chemotaxis protein
MALVLIVDDEQPIRTVIRMLMSDAGYETVEAIDGSEALTLIDRARPDLIISDVMMPVLDGLELSRQLRAQDKTRAIPIILMTAARKRILEESNANAIILKPFDLTDLEEMVGRLLKARSF